MWDIKSRYVRTVYLKKHTWKIKNMHLWPLNLIIRRLEMKPAHNAIIFIY